MKNKTKLLLLGLLLPGMSAFGQDQNNPNKNDAKTPSAQKGGSDIHGVDLYTGTANVSIPIYKYSVDGLDLGISLGYNLKGVRVDDIATSVGLGFNLSAGGSIERTVYDVEDEVFYPAGSPVTNPPGSPANDRYGWWTVNGGDGDQGQDQFHLNLCGKSYTFTYKMTTEPSQPNDRKFRVSPKSEIHIDIQDNMGTSGFDPKIFYPSDCNNYPFYKYPFTHQLTFHVFDEKNNHFIFEAADYEFTQRSMLNDTNTKYDFRPVNKWNLSKIITYTGQEIRYFYKSFAAAGLPYYSSVEVNEKFNHTGVLGNIKVKKTTKPWQGVTYHIQRIEYPNGTTAYFNFEDTDQSKIRCDNVGVFPLHDIRIVGKNGTHENSYTYLFNYAYFNSPKGSNTATEIAYPQPCSTIANSYGIGTAAGLDYNKVGLRLKLKSIERVGTDAATKEPFYRFEYNATALPSRMSPSKDFYGYYNGKTPVNPPVSASCSTSYNAADLANLGIPLHTVSNFNSCGDNVTYGVDRTPDIQYMQAFLLNKVINGSGGETEFKFKDHSLSNPANQYSESHGNPPFTVPSDLEGQNANDGLCIDEIIVSDGFNSDNTVRTKYTFSGGQRFYRGGYFWYPVQLAGNGDVWERVYKEHFVNPQDFFKGSNHGYSDVTLETFGYNNERIAYKKFKFSNLIDHWTPTWSNLRAMNQNFYANTFRPYEFRTYRMGLPLETSEHDPVGGALLSKTVNEYIDGGLPLSPGMDQAYPIGQEFYYMTWGGTAMDKIQGGFYTPFFGRKMWLNQSTTTRYVNGTGYPSTMTYGYDKFDNVKYVGWTDSRGINYRKHYVYYYDAHGGVPIPQEFEQHVVTTSVWKMIGTTDSALVNGEAFTFYGQSTPDHMWTTKKVVSLKGTDLMSSTDAGGAGTLYQVAFNPSAGSPALQTLIETDKQYNALDSKGGITETNEAQVKADVAGIWDNRIGQKIADVPNAKFIDIAYTSFEGNYEAAGIADENKGNWDFNPVYVDEVDLGGYNGGAMTGRHRYGLTGIPAKIVSSNNLQANKKYLLTFWATGAPIAKVTNGTQQQSITFSQQREIGAWKLFTAVLNNSFAGKVEFTGNSGVQIDELRLHPIEATMTTTCYEPLYGPNTTCDGLNNISYQEYDVLGRATTTRDIKGYIRSYTQLGKATTDN